MALPQKLLGEVNFFIRQANPERATALVSKLLDVISPKAGEDGVQPESTSMPDLVAAVSTVMASAIMQGDPRTRQMLVSVFGALLSENLNRMILAEAADKAAAEAVAAERGTANGLPI